MKQWYFQHSGKTIGPLTGVDLLKLAADGQITAETLIKRNGTDRWVTADCITGLLGSTSSTESPQEPKAAASRSVQARFASEFSEAQTEVDSMPVIESTIKEYKVLTQKDRWFSGKFDPEKLEEALNAYAEHGWVVKAATTATIPGLMSGTRDEMIIILER
ncbi:MAG: DUF4177 domain-containing protein [Planctomycetaceae bacterium]|nr:DUF4177 domain-containing protein [Planctomycetaceae bacterium]